MFENMTLTVVMFLVLILLLYGLFLFLIAPGRKNKTKSDKLDELLKFHYAHRGLHNLQLKVPENSMTAFVLAKEAGYGIELDLNLTKDGRVAVFHDADLLRACDVDLKVEELTWDELSEYKIFGTDEKIPLLSDVLKVIDGKIPLLIELKNTKHYKKLCTETALLIDSYKGNCCIESFNPKIVYWFKKNRPNLVRGQLSSNVSGLGKENIVLRFFLSSLMFNVMSRPDFVAYYYLHVKGKFGIKNYRMLGGKLFGWTIADEKSANEYLPLFDSIIFENFTPDKIKIN